MKKRLLIFVCFMLMASSLFANTDLYNHIFSRARSRDESVGIILKNASIGDIRESTQPIEVTGKVIVVNYAWNIVVIYGGIYNGTKWLGNYWYISYDDIAAVRSNTQLY